MLFPQLGPINNCIYNNLWIIIAISGVFMSVALGQSFNKWTVLDKDGRNTKGDQLYRCACVCGAIKKHTLYNLKHGVSKQCKQCFMSSLNSTECLTGKTFGSWNVLEKTKNESRNEWHYLCRCDCGFTRNIAGSNLKSGHTTQCHKCRNKTHGMSYTDTFKIWTGILRRCLNKNFKAYKYYGGRGIQVCDRWLKFDNFLADMGERPAKLQIDRIDNDGNYEPGNCHWVTPRENLLNRKLSNKNRGS